MLLGQNRIMDMEFFGTLVSPISLRGMMEEFSETKQDLKFHRLDVLRCTELRCPRWRGRQSEWKYKDFLDLIL